MTAPPIDRVLTIPEVARLAGWDRIRMWRHLKRLNNELGGMLLHRSADSSGRWTVTLRALQAIAPQWFCDEESVHARLAEIEERLGRTERIQALHTEKLAQL